MFAFCGFNFLDGFNAVDSAPIVPEEITSLTIQDSHFLGVEFDRDNAPSTLPYTTGYPTYWQEYTIMQCLFDNTVESGNPSADLRGVDTMRVKRKSKNSYEWITIKEIPVTSTVDVNFSINDFTNINGVEYTYALVPVSRGVEGNYITADITSEFRGIYIGDATGFFNLSYNTDTSYERKTNVASYTPIGAKYPTIISNSKTEYDEGSMTALVINEDFPDTRILNREKCIKKEKELTEFLVNKQPKILKDSAGHTWLVAITSTANISYQVGGTEMPTIRFGWTEIGDPNNSQDLLDSGLAL